MNQKDRVEFYYNQVKTISVTGLKNMYSPMFDKTFYEMTDDEIKKQLDYWVIHEYDEHKHIFEERKPLTKDQREKNFNNFIKGKRK